MLFNCKFILFHFIMYVVVKNKSQFYTFLFLFQKYLPIRFWFPVRQNMLTNKSIYQIMIIHTVKTYWRSQLTSNITIYKSSGSNYFGFQNSKFFLHIYLRLTNRWPFYKINFTTRLINSINPDTRICSVCVYEAFFLCYHYVKPFLIILILVN